MSNNNVIKKPVTLEVISKDINKVSNNLDDLARITKTGFDGVNKRSELIEMRLDHLDARLAMRLNVILRRYEKIS